MTSAFWCLTDSISLNSLVSSSQIFSETWQRNVTSPFMLLITAHSSHITRTDWRWEYNASLWYFITKNLNNLGLSQTIRELYSLDFFIWDSWWNDFGFYDVDFRIQWYWSPLRSSIQSSPVNLIIVSFPPVSLAFHMAGFLPVSEATSSERPS